MLAMLCLGLLGPAVCATETEEGADVRFAFCCRPDNDLYTVLSAKEPCPRYDTPHQAVAAAREGSALLVLADGCPDHPTAVEQEVYEAARAKGLRMYVEFPAALPGLEVGAPRGTFWERAVIASRFFAPDLAPMRILAIHDCRFVPVQAQSPHLVMARVAGLDTAIYGLPAESFPVLFEHPSGNLLVATTKLSQFITARYSPTEAWGVVWQRILAWLSPGMGVDLPTWTPTVRPSFARDEPLPADAEAQALRRGSGWFIRSGLLAKSSTEYELAKTGGPAPPTAGEQGGDGSHGIYEGFGAHINWDGSQTRALAKRGDCNGEAAMGLAIGGTEEGRRIAARILDYWYFDSIAQQGKRADPHHPAFGLASWGISEYAWERAFYGDDNARLLLGTWAAAALLHGVAGVPVVQGTGPATTTDRWNEAVTKCLLANLRTTGRLGFRLDRIDLPDLEANGWRHYYDAFTVSYAPHYQAYLWACYLWAYRATGYELFLERAKSAIRMTMAAYPARWRWTNGIAQERARMLLPLAWLVRVEDTPEHREWLRRIAEDLLALQDECGAIREELGPPGSGAYGPPASNEAYGTNEATLIQQNGDPICDLLYTTNFAFIGLHEAAAATGDPYYADAEAKLARFLCRIQVCSEAHPELDGAWYRAFDFGKWDYWASSADAGWGVWSIESGWTQGWITAVFGLRQMRTSLWDLTAGLDLRGERERLQPVFFPEGDAVSTAGMVQHLALGKAVTLAAQPDPAYPGIGEATLTDGRLGLADHRDPAWLGFQGPDLEAVIDLGAPMRIAVLRSEYLQSVRVGVFLPSRVEYAVSDDRTGFRVVATVDCATSQQEPGPLTREFVANLPQAETARYVRVHARSLGVIPDWHNARGRKAWLFVAEIMVQ